jgi:hypothetical protein
MSVPRFSILLVGLATLFFPAFLIAQASPNNGGQTTVLESPRFSLDLRPAFDAPLGPSGSVFGVGGSIFLGAQYRLPSLPLYFCGGIGYDYDAVDIVPLSVSVTSASLGSGLRFKIVPWMDFEVEIGGGYYYCFINDLSATSSNPFVGGSAGFLFLPGPLHVCVGTTYRYYLGLYNGIAGFAGVSYDLIESMKSATRQNPATKVQPLKGESTGPVELKQISLDDIFPVFRTYYDTHPLGKVILHNTLGQPVTGLKVRFQIKEFMPDPKDCPSPSELGPGEAKEVDLFGLFLPAILETTEKTKAQARIDLEYTVDGQVEQQDVVQSITILDRNATTWVDNRRAAAFVTTKDPAVLTFSKVVNGTVKGKIQSAISPNILTAMAFFDALQLYGLTYSQDPIPTVTSGNLVADYIQFPRQTLQYKGGKCSDFSVLYAALLESVGIETAFITAPGHIFIAFSTGLSSDDSRKLFSRPDDLVIRADKSWIPVEVTENAGFLKAWQDGAKEWRESQSGNKAGFYPLHEAWQVYEPVGLTGAEVSVNLPPGNRILTKCQEEMGAFIDQEIAAKVASLKSQILKSEDPRKPTNALGVLYARYGQYDQAQQQFEKLLAKEEYTPALLNMGNICYLNGDKEKALSYYNRAYAKDPHSPEVLLAVAKVNHDLENYYQVKKVYVELEERDPDLAQKFAYLDLKGEEATRAAEANGVKGVVIWEEQ